MAKGLEWGGVSQENRLTQGNEVVLGGRFGIQNRGSDTGHLPLLLP